MRTLANMLEKPPGLHEPHQPRLWAGWLFQITERTSSSQCLFLPFLIHMPTKTFITLFIHLFTQCFAVSGTCYCPKSVFCKQVPAELEWRALVTPVTCCCTGTSTWDRCSDLSYVKRHPWILLCEIWAKVSLLPHPALWLSSSFPFLHIPSFFFYLIMLGFGDFSFFFFLPIFKFFSWVAHI